MKKQSNPLILPELKNSLFFLGKNTNLIRLNVKTLLWENINPEFEFENEQDKKLLIFKNFS